MTEKLNVLQQMDPYIGKYFSVEYIRTNILNQTETEMEEIDAEMADDIKSGRAIDPLQMVAADQQQIDADSENLELDQEMKKAQIAQAKQKPAAQNTNGNK